LKVIKDSLKNLASAEGFLPGGISAIDPRQGRSEVNPPAELLACVVSPDHHVDGFREAGMLIREQPMTNHCVHTGRPLNSGFAESFCRRLTVADREHLHGVAIVTCRA